MSQLDRDESAGATTAPYDARSVANLVLDRVFDHGKNLTQLQLYKIVYFAHGWYLAEHGAPLVSQSFEAWKYGPVLRVLRDSFKEFGQGPITRKAERFDLFSGELSEPDAIVDEVHLNFIIQIVDFYHEYDGWDLSDLTHEEGSPWDSVWNSKIPVGNLGLRIDDNAIRSYFVRLGMQRQIH